MDAAMGAMGLGIVLTLRDQASNGLDKIRAKMSGLQGVTQKMVKDFDANAKKLMAGIGMMWTGSKVFNSFNNLFGSSIQTAANFEQAMAGVAAVSGATGADFERLSAQARQLGRDTQFSASQAANAQELLARAGFQTKEIIQSMPGLLNMAAAEGMGLAEAADIAASSLRGFGMDASEMTRVSNILAQASASSNVSIASLGEALKNVAPDAKSLGLNIEQVSAMIGMLGNAGIKGGRAGTALASALSKISSPGSAAQKALANLGVEIMTQTGDLRNFPDILSELSQAMRAQGLGSAQKGSILKELFGLTTKTEVQALMDAIDTGKLQELSAELLNVGDAAGTMAGKMNATYQGAMKRLESASEGLQIAIGNIFIPVKTWFIDKYASIKSAIAGFIENFPVISKAVLGGAGAIMTLVGSVLTLNGALMAAQGASKIWKLAMKSSGLSVTKALYAPLTRGFMYFKEARQMGLAMSESFRYTFAILRTQAGNSIKGMLQALWSIPGPIKLIVAALGLMAAAYKTNFAGFRDMITAISTGWKFALAASKDGILEVDEATAQQLEKAGLWDTVQNMGKVFFRVLEFFRGFKEGVVEALSFVSNAFAKIGDVFKPFIVGGTACLKFLGILSPVVETQASSWRTVGKWVGYAVSALLPLVAVYKSVKIAVSAWSAAQAVLNAVM
nr:phage tail tape measure protein [Synergistaceae bacterium]